jgi:hypothetical protein
MRLVLDPPGPVAPVIRLDFDKQTKIEREGRACYHRGAFALDGASRSVHCGSCGAPLDPFQLLLDYAERERTWRYYDSEIRRAEAKLDELKDEERKVKARTKSANRKDAAAAVSAERVRTERERMEISDLARDVAGLARRIERTARALSKETEGGT